MSFWSQFLWGYFSGAGSANELLPSGGDPPLAPPPRLDPNRWVPPLPPEIFREIVSHLAQPFLPPDCAPYAAYRQKRKETWISLVGVASSSKYYRHLLVGQWFHVIIVADPGDWALVQDPSWLGHIEPHVRIIISAHGALTSSLRFQTDTRILGCFDHLESVSVDYHNDFLRNGGQYPYYQLVRKLPASLKKLEVLNAHGPDEQIINLVAQCCPELTELRLGRCTMFNNRDCVWWKAHPADHDAYMAERGVEAYAGAVGNLIKHVLKLRVLHIGVYLTPIEAVWTHRVDHRKLHPIFDSMAHENPEGVHNHLHQVALALANGEDPDPPINRNYPPLARREIWEAPCALCEERFQEPAEKAEMRTAAVIAARSWSLRQVSFASFTSPGRVGSSAWEVLSQDGVTDEILDNSNMRDMLSLFEDKGESGYTITVTVRKPQGSVNKGSLKGGRFTFRLTWSDGQIKVSPPLIGPGLSLMF